MKMRTSLSLLFVLMIVFGLYAWSSSSEEPILRDTKAPKTVVKQGVFGPQAISGNVQMAFWPALAINNRDELMVVFGEEFTGGEIYSTVSLDKGATWSPPLHTDSIVYTVKAIDVVDDQEGNFHMVYSDGGSSTSREIYYRYYKDGAWQPRERVSVSVGNVNWAHIDVEGDTVYIAWYEEPGGAKPLINMKEKTIGGVWPDEPEDVTQDPSNGYLYPDIKVKNGNVHTIFQIHIYVGDEVSTKVIAFKERINGIWRPTVDLTPWAWPDIEVDDLGYVHTLFPNKGKVIYQSRNPAGAWSSALAINNRGGMDGFFDQDSRNGVLIAVYTADAVRSSEHWSVYYRVKKFDKGAWGSWGEEVEIDPGGTAELPKVIIDSEGYAHIVWADWSSVITRIPDAIYHDKFKVGEPDAPFMILSKYSLDFRAPQGDPAGTKSFKIRNGGPNTLNFTASSNSWITVTPSSGTVGEDWLELFVDVDTNIAEGDHEGTITLTSPEAANSPQTVKVKLKVDPPPIFEPLNFSVNRKENKTYFYREIIHVLEWEPNPLNKDITKYLITCEYEKNGMETTQKFEVISGTYEYSIRNVSPGTTYTYSIQAVDAKNRMGPAAVFIIEEK